jgi:hypothetical protein
VQKIYGTPLYVVLSTTIRPNKNRMGAQSSNTRKIVNRLVSLPGPLLLTEYVLLGWSKTLKILINCSNIVFGGNFHNCLTFFIILKATSLFSKSFFQKILSLCINLLVY